MKTGPRLGTTNGFFDARPNSKRTVFSQDDDFLVETHTWLLSGRHFAGVVYGHQQRVTIGQAVSELELIAKVMEEEEMIDRVIYIPMR